MNTALTVLGVLELVVVVVAVALAALLIAGADRVPEAEPTDAPPVEDERLFDPLRDGPTTDLAAVRADDELIETLRVGTQPGLDAEPLEQMLAAWRDEVGS